MSWIDTAPLLPFEQADARTVAEEKEAVLAAVALCFTLETACAQAGVSVRRAYRWQASDSAFAAAVDTAKAHALQLAVGELYQRGVLGHPKPVYQSGKRVMDVDPAGNVVPATVMERDTTALIVLLKGNLREQYGDRLDVSHHGMVAKAYQGVDLARIGEPDSRPAGEDSPGTPLLSPGSPSEE